MNTCECYAWADNSINLSPGYATGFTQLLATHPYRLPPAEWNRYDTRLPPIRAFQKTAIDLFRAALAEETHPDILHWLMNDIPESYGLRYHRSLEERHFTLPVFFRTDEVKPGRIVEINAPAALWGEFQLAFEHVSRTGHCAGETSPASQYADQLTRYLQTAPVVDQFLDNSTSPGSWRFFIERTRPALRYWGIDRIARRRDCNFIRGQSFIGLCIDDQFPWRLAHVGKGVTYDTAPYMLFDQKATLVLPFWSLTRAAFSDQVRDLFPFTSPLLPAGIELPDGARVTIEDFSRRPRAQRPYYLKYAGADWTLNFGSRAVTRLSNLSSNACLAQLQQCLSTYQSGRIWLLQQEETQDDDIVYLTRDGAVHTDRLRAKFCGFYGPEGCIGVLAMHGSRNKVHGREDTVLSFGVSTQSDLPAPKGDRKDVPDGAKDLVAA